MARRIVKMMSWSHQCLNCVQCAQCANNTPGFNLVLVQVWDRAMCCFLGSLNSVVLHRLQTQPC